MRGLSLLELLVSVTLMALIAAFMAQTLGIARSIQQRGEALSVQLEIHAAATSSLRRLLRNAVSPVRLRPDTAFSGTEETLRFAALPVPEVGGGGFYVFGLDCDGRTAMTLRWRPGQAMADADPKAKWISETVLWPGMPCHGIGYFDSDSPAVAASMRWHDEWSENPESLPRLIRIAMSARGVPGPPPIYLGIVE